jgi:hypothetical protein
VRCGTKCVAFNGECACLEKWAVGSIGSVVVRPDRHKYSSSSRCPAKNQQNETTHAHDKNTEREVEPKVLAHTRFWGFWSR